MPIVKTDNGVEIDTDRQVEVQRLHLSPGVLWYVRWTYEDKGTWPWTRIEGVETLEDVIARFAPKEVVVSG